MGLVQLFRARRIWKARASAGNLPEEALRDSYVIAAQHESEFVRAFQKVARDMITPNIEAAFLAAWESGSISEVMSTLPYFDDDPAEGAVKVYNDKMTAAYLATIQDAGDESTDILNKEFGIKLKFSALPPPDPNVEIIQKTGYDAIGQRKAVNAVNNAIRDGRLKRKSCEICGKSPAEAHHDDYSKLLNVRWFCRKHHIAHHVNMRAKAKKKLEKQIIQKAKYGTAGMGVGINPYSIKWVKEHGLELSKQMGSTQRKTLNGIIGDAMEAGTRPTDMIKQIKANIGLTARDYGATVKRMQLHLDAGMSEDMATGLTRKYSNKLLASRAKTIARTETIFAQSRGRRDAWIVAEESGGLPPVEREWVTQPPSANPAAPCPICLPLNGTKAPLKGVYESSVGAIEGPPAHPRCRCTEILGRAEVPADAVPVVVVPPKVVAVPKPKPTPKPKPKPKPVAPPVVVEVPKPKPDLVVTPPKKPRPKKYKWVRPETAIVDMPEYNREIPGPNKASRSWARKMKKNSPKHMEYIKQYTYGDSDFARALDAKTKFTDAQLDKLVAKAYQGKDDKTGRISLALLKDLFRTGPAYTDDIYRGMKNIDAVEARKMFAVGNTWESDAISSFTKDLKVAAKARFSGDWFPGAAEEHVGIILKAKMKSGAVEISRLSSIPEEAEVLVNKGKKFKIVKVDEVDATGITKLLVTMEEIK